MCQSCSGWGYEACLQGVLSNLVLVDVHLVGGKERLPNDVDPPIHKRRAFHEARKSANMDGERAILTRLGGPPNSCEEAWRKCTHMGEDFREGRIRTATEISREFSQVHSRLADITELKAPVEVVTRSGWDLREMTTG
jgi:hypothetical protein